MELTLAKSKADLFYENQPAGDPFLDLGFREDIALVFDPRIEIPEAAMTFKTKDLSLKNNLSLALSQFSLKSAMFGGTLLITKPEWLPIRNPAGRPTAANGRSAAGFPACGPIACPWPPRAGRACASRAGACRIRP
jgi:hypothetical protein